MRRGLGRSAVTSNPSRSSSASTPARASGSVAMRNLHRAISQGLSMDGKLRDCNVAEDMLRRQMHVTCASAALYDHVAS
jgi:hypothetical protein